MIALDAHVYLDSFLAPLAEYLERDDVTDIYVNRPGEIWLEALGGRVERRSAPLLQRPVLMRLARQIAARSAQGVNREHPLLAAALPDGSRVQIILPPATRGEIAIAIRKHLVSALSLDDYRASGSLTGVSIGMVGEGRNRNLIAGADCDAVDMLRQAVRGRRNILISGGTSSGKTTFLNALLREIPERERLVLIEDTPELQILHANAVGLLAVRGGMGEANVTAEDLLIASLRMRPDRIILGEIRGNEALTFLRAINTGHPGSLSTIHADSAERAIDQLSLLALQAGSGLNWTDAGAYIHKSLDIVVQLERSSQGPKIRTIAML